MALVRSHSAFMYQPDATDKQRKEKCGGKTTSWLLGQDGWQQRARGKRHRHRLTCLAAIAAFSSFTGVLLGRASPRSHWSHVRWPSTLQTDATRLSTQKCLPFPSVKIRLLLLNVAHRPRLCFSLCFPSSLCITWKWKTPV